MDAYTLFNRKLEEFAKELVTAFPFINDFKLLKNAVRMASLMDEKVPQRVFQEYVALPYDAFILKKDEQFFLEETYDAAMRNAKETTPNVDLNIVEKLKLVWKSLDASSKDALWQHMQVLSVLNKRCMQSKTA